jgi:hypothetical protein
VETPQGLFELKFFFHSGIASGDGEMVSSVSVKKMIQDLLANEDPAKPLSRPGGGADPQGPRAHDRPPHGREVSRGARDPAVHQRRLAPKRR